MSMSTQKTQWLTMALNPVCPVSAAKAEPGHAADIIFAGGGLANGLLAWRLQQLRPDLRLLLLESGPALGGNHTWSFHDADLTPAQHAWIAPLVAHRWPGYQVHFPQRQRRLATGYSSVSSTRFDAVLQADLAAGAVRLNTPVAEVQPRFVRLADGAVLHARLAVVDGRGAAHSPHLALGFQKFLGQEVRLAEPHGMAEPMLIDATVAQHDGYRFVYVLPLTADTLLIEDTFYADGEAVDVPRLRRHIADYAAAHGWAIQAVLREEFGILPITLAGDAEAFWRDAGGVPRTGLAAGLFNPATGYSLPDAVRLADRLVALQDWSAPALFADIQSYASSLWRSQAFFRLLNRMLFKAGDPGQRWSVIQRFYGLRTPLISRFYAGQPTFLDKARILSGKPPVPLGAAMRAAVASSALVQAQQQQSRQLPS